MTTLNFFSVCWWLFIIIWVVTAWSVKPAKEKQNWGGKLFTYAFGTLAGMLLMGVIPWWGLNTRIWPFTQPILWLAYGLTLAGLGTLIWARWTLGTNWSATVTFREDHKLIEHGPYRFVRHPIYTGVFLMVAGTTAVVGKRSAVLALLIIFFGHWWKLKQEEALLIKHFPDTYPQYKARTKALIPYIF